jgi:hypothetical protein
MKKVVELTVLLILASVFLYACSVALGKLNERRKVTINSQRDATEFKYPNIMVCPSFFFDPQGGSNFQQNLNSSTEAMKLIHLELGQTGYCTIHLLYRNLLSMQGKIILTFQQQLH